jgi:predicted transcriptional regulator
MGFPEGDRGRGGVEPLTPAEWKVMRVVWGLGGAGCAARDVYTEAGRRHGWSASTVKTLLRRLVEKGYVRTTAVGNSFLYRPARSALSSLKGAADALLEHALEGTTGPLIAHMVRKGNLTQQEIDGLRALLDGAGAGPEEETR